MKKFKFFPKVLSFLLLLLFSSNTFSFSFPPSSDTDEQSLINAEIDQADHELLISSLSPVLPIQVFQKNFCDALLFRLSSARIENQENQYFKNCGKTIPSLDIPLIIFPFHFFF